MDWESVHHWLLRTRLGRRFGEATLRHRLHRRLARWDEAPPQRSQAQILLRLVGQSRRTPFGIDHDFGRIRTVTDFQRLVPLRTAADLSLQYGPCEPATAELANHRDALLAGLALTYLARPRARLLSGALLLADGDPVHELPRPLRPFAVVATEPFDASLAALPVTCLIGNAARLHGLWSALRELTARERFHDIWPSLAAVLYTRSPGDPERHQLAQVSGDAPVLLETCLRPEGVLAIEDPRHQLLRILPDQGMFFEFVPLEELNRSHPARHDLGEVVPGVPYTLALTTSAGLWACLVGLTVCFERGTLPLLRSVEEAVPTAPPSAILPLRTEGPTVNFPAQPHRPPSADTPVAPPRRLGRSPWSGRADQR